MFYEKYILKNFAKSTEKNLCWSSFLINLQIGDPQYYLKETLTQLFPCKFGQVFKNTFLILLYILSYYFSLNAKSCLHIETSQLICRANQLTDFYMIGATAFNPLMPGGNKKVTYT